MNNPKNVHSVKKITTEFEGLKPGHLSDSVLDVTLREVPIFDRVTVPPDATVQEVIDLMHKHNTGAVLVDDPKTGKLEGIFTERDLLLRIAGKGWDFSQHKIKEVMTPNPDTLSPNCTVGYSLNMMITNGYRHVPIVRGNGESYAMVTVRNLLHYMWKFFPEDVVSDDPAEDSGRYAATADAGDAT